VNVSMVTGDILDVCEAFMDKAVAGTGWDVCPQTPP
jgi:hypothetical protein